MKRARRFIITLVPVVTLFLITAATIIADIFEGYDTAYLLLSQLFGYGLFWLPVYFYMQKAYHLCTYTFIALVGLTIYSVINIGYIVLPVKAAEYVGAYEGAVMGVMSAITILFIIQNFTRYGRANRI